MPIRANRCRFIREMSQLWTDFLKAKYRGRFQTRVSLNKGYTENGFADKVYHIHLRYDGDNDELYFRDYLNDHPDVAKEYETLKLQLWKQYDQTVSADGIDLQIMRECQELSESKKKRLLAYVSMLQSTKE